jgi:hypothetical protein
VTEDNVTDENVTDQNVTDQNVTDTNLTDDNVTDGNVTEEDVDENVTDVQVPNLNATVENATLSLTNPTDVTVLANVSNETGPLVTETVETNETTNVSDLAPGNYSVAAETEAGENVTVNNRTYFNFTVEAEPVPELATLNATVDNATLTLENPNDATVLANVSNETGPVETVTLFPNGTETVTDLAPGNYTVTAETDAGENVTVNNETEFTFGVEAEALPELAGLNATVENETLTLSNPDDVTVVATVANETGVVEEATVAADANETVTDLAPGNYTVTAETEDGRNVTVEGNETFEFAVVETDEWPPDATAIDDGVVTTRDVPAGGAWFSVEADAGDLLNVVHASQDAAPEVVLYNESGAELDRGTSGPLARSFGVEVNETGTHYVFVSNDDLNGSAGISVTLGVQTRSPADVEPNDVRENATAVPATGPAEGAVAEGDVDRFAVEATTGQRITATLTREAPEIQVGDGLRVSILAPNGTEIGEYPLNVTAREDCRAAPRTCSGEQAGALGEDLDQAVQSAVAPMNGTYYVRVSGFEYDDGTASVDGYVNYSLAVEQSTPLFDRIVPPQDVTVEPGTQLLFEVGQGPAADRPPVVTNTWEGPFVDDPAR